MGNRLGAILDLKSHVLSRVGDFLDRASLPGEKTKTRPAGRDTLQDENSARYFAIVDTAVDAIMVVDRFGRLEAFNHAAEGIFGYSAAEVLGQNIKILMPEPYHDAHDGYLNAYRTTGEKKIIGIGREVRGQRKDGSVVPLELSIAEWHDTDGKQWFTGIMRDVTLRNQQVRELNEMREAADRARVEAEAANMAKTEFLAVMSHEIRTPLTSISGFMDLLARSGKMTVKQQRYIELVRSANAALLTIVNDVLDFSKVEAGQLELELRAFSPVNLIESIVSIVRPLATEKNVKMRFKIDKNVPQWVMGDHSRLRQILLNLLNNAVKFTPSGSITVHVRRSKQKADDQLWFSVKDTGIGIPVEQQHRLFKQFSQADSSITRSHGGTGLGLAICKRLVELMNGEIGIVSEAGYGTIVEFSARLPQVERPMGLLDEELKVPLRHGGSKAKALKILLVDDLDTNREIVKAYLEDEGYAVASVSNAPDAIGILQKNHFDLVLMDIQMPVMDGVTATHCIRALGKPVADIPIIAMTGNVLPVQVRAFLDSGMNDHVAKPIERSKLYSTVLQWLPQESSHVGEPQGLPGALLFNQSRFNEAVWALGVARVQLIVDQFLSQLAGSFNSDAPATAREAHDLINPAGVLGFDSLVAVCQQHQVLELFDHEPHRATSDQLVSLKAEVQLVAAAQVIPQLRSIALGTVH